MDAHKLAARHTVKELVKLMQADELNPVNRNPPGSIAILNKRGQKRADVYAWAITYRRCNDQGKAFPAATFKNYKTRR